MNKLLQVWKGGGGGGGSASLHKLIGMGDGASKMEGIGHSYLKNCYLSLDKDQMVFNPLPDNKV